jgi:intracellular septation protein A
VFYAALGAANLVIARYATEKTWVYSKIGLTILTFIFAILQVVYLVRRGEPTDATPPVQEPPPV